MSVGVGAVSKLVLVLCAAVPALIAQDSKPASSLPPWAAEWRVTGIIRQGQSAQASMERTGVRSRFVKEGDHLPGDIAVLEVNYTERCVTIGKGGETAVIHAKNAMLPAIPPPKVAGMMQPPRPGGNTSQGSWPNPPQRTTAMRDGNGRWHVVFPNGNAVDMQSVVERRGSVQGAMEHAQGHLDRETSPERIEYFKEEMRALKAMRDAGQR